MDLLKIELAIELQRNHNEQQRRIRLGQGGDPNDVAAAQSHLNSPTEPPSIGSAGLLDDESENPDSASSEERRTAVCIS